MTFRFKETCVVEVVAAKLEAQGRSYDIKIKRDRKLGVSYQIRIFGYGG